MPISVGHTVCSVNATPNLGRYVESLEVVLPLGKPVSTKTRIPNQCPYQVSASDTLWFLRYSPDKIL